MKNTLKIIVLSVFLLGGFCAMAQSEWEADATGNSAILKPEAITITNVLPNPATDRIRVEFLSNRMGEEMELRLKNEDGKIVFRRNLIALKGNNVVILSIKALPAGEYVVQLDEGRRSRSVRWQKM